MAELYLKGYLCLDSDRIIALNETEPKDVHRCFFAHSVISSLEDFAREYGMYGEHRKGLGGRRAIIDECNLRVYFTDKECELEDAMLAMDVLMYGGDIETKVDLEGYSEYTITGLSLDKFSIGGHDLYDEFSCHLGEYCHILIDC